MRGRSAPGSLQNSQKQLYLAVRKELAPFERGKRRELKLYERAFRNGIPRNGRASTRHALLTAIKNARIVLVGDFHPFRQSQKGFIRLIEGATNSRSRAVIALECFRQSQQGVINQFLAGLITLEELREETNFDAHWPFPWENYREILSFARRAKFSVIALNIPGTLRARDLAASARIVRQLVSHPSATVFTLFGELHLGRAHLPRSLRKALGPRSAIVTVHQNDPELYWRAPTLADGQKPEVIRLGTSEFCILNSVPWVKLRSYLDWLEGSPTPDLEDNHLDAVGLVHHYARLLAAVIEISRPLDDRVEVLLPDRASRRTPALRELPSPDRELLAHALHYRRTGYLPRQGAIILATVSTNSLLEAATHLLRHSMRTPLEKKCRWGVEERIAHFFLGYLGSKLLNPKRKCDEVPDLQRRAASRDAVAKRALALLRPFLKDETLKSSRSLSGEQGLEAARAAGFVLGERYFQALLQTEAALGEIRALFFASDSKALLRKVAMRISRARVAPASKGEKF